MSVYVFWARMTYIVEVLCVVGDAGIGLGITHV